MQQHPPTAALCHLAVVLALITACVPVSTGDSLPITAAQLMTSDGTNRGSAQLSQKGDQLELAIVVTGLSPHRQHGIHLHAVGACQPPSFASAGPHLNPAARQHGLANPQGSHLGDLPNIATNSAGTGHLTVALPGSARLLRNQLFDADGTAVVLHADPDDLRSDPAGNSGSRIACGALTPHSSSGKLGQ